MTHDMTPAGIVALTYPAGTNPASLLRSIAAELIADGIVCAGFIQRDVERAGRSRCDMILEEIRTGTAIPISEDRGDGARGCRLDECGLSRAIVATLETLNAAPDVIFINKFGKAEAEGRGFRPLIAEAVERNIPVLIAVPLSNIESWRHFSSGFAVEFAIERLPAEVDHLRSVLGLDRPRRIGSDPARNTPPDALERRE